MTAYSIIYTRTNSHNFVTEVQVKGICFDHKEAENCFNSIRLQIMYGDPKYEIAKKEGTIKHDNYEFAFWVDSTGIDEENGGYTYSDYYEVTLRIIQSTIVYY